MSERTYDYDQKDKNSRVWARLKVTEINNGFHLTRSRIELKENSKIEICSTESFGVLSKEDVKQLIYILVKCSDLSKEDLYPEEVDLYEFQRDRA